MIKVRINPETGPQERDLAIELGVRGYPTLILVRPGGDLRRIRTPSNAAELRRSVS